MKSVRRRWPQLHDRPPVAPFLMGAAAAAALLWATGLLTLDGGCGGDCSWQGNTAGGASGAANLSDPYAMPPGGAYNEARCGTWHREYVALHQRILAGAAPQRYAVAAGWEGWADSVVGAVTIFYFALFTGRAFQMSSTRFRMNNTSPVKYDWMWEKPWIDWNGSQVAHPQLLYVPMDPNDASPKQQAWLDFFRHGNMSELGPEYEVIKFETNLGFTVGMFENPFYRERLFRMGLRPETAFGCAFDFLLYPKRRLFEEHAGEYAALAAPGPLKVGIQIRAGDKVIRGEEETSLDFFGPFFDCAAQLEEHYALPGQRVIWYLITDSLTLRRQAREQYGDKLLVSDPSIPVGHFLWEPGDTPSLRAAAMDNWLFGLTDFQVISRSSGFGRTGGFRSGRQHQMFTLDNFRPVARNCSAQSYDTLKALAALGDGVRMGLNAMDNGMLAGHPGV